MNPDFLKWRQLFNQRLNTLYPEQEIASIFRWTAEHIQHNSKEAIEIETHFESCLNRLSSGEPLQYIIGEWDFFGRRFLLNPSVLIPRPETEELVDHCLKLELPKSAKVLDIGTGSGCIAISLKAERPDWQLSAMDVSEEALKLAAQNAVLNSTNIQWINVNVLEDQSGILHGNFDLIVSNPPYVTRSEATQMRKNVVDFEPHLALFVPDHDSLVFYRRIAQLGKAFLNPGGWIALEINEALPEETAAVLVKNGFEKVQHLKDMQGKWRFVLAQKSNEK